jgi:hypothetical protein
VRNGEVSISISLPRQAVSLIEVDWNGSIPRSGYAAKPRVASTPGNRRRI